MDCSEKMDRLNQIAESDEIYNIWKLSRQEYIKTFEEYANSQPDEIKNMLWGYAEGGMMMMQRKVYLACSRMDFISSETKVD